MYTQNQFNHVLNTLFEPFDEASSITIRYTCKPQTDTQEPPSYKITDVNGFKTPQAYGEHLAFLHSALMEQVEPTIVKLSVADRGHFFLRAQERCSKLLAEIHEELPSPEVLRCGKPFRVIRVFNRPVFQPAEDIRPGDALAIKLSRHSHAWAWQWWLSLNGLQDMLKSYYLHSIVNQGLSLKPGSLPPSGKIALEATAGELAHMGRLLAEIGVLVVKNKEQLFRAVSAAFTTTRSNSLSEAMLKHKFNDPDAIHVKRVNEALHEMLKISENFNQCA